MINLKNKIISLAISVIIIIIDQVIKLVVFDNLRHTNGIELIKGVFELQYVENTGAAFSIFSNQTIVLSIITSIIMIALVFILFSKKITGNIEIYCISLILAGGVGNLIDRVFRGFVIDYIYFKPINFPVFNLADICVCCGAFAAILLLSIREFKKDKV